MIIHMLCNDGSPLGITSKTIWGDQWQIGTGGSEYAMITLCEEWHNQGHEVVLYNDPKERNASPFEQRFIQEFEVNAPRDVLINFRSPNYRTISANNCLKVWFSTDQMSVGDYRSFAPHVHKIVTISPRHAQYFSEQYGINNSIVIDLPVRTYDYDGIKEDKVPNRILFSSVPARGLDNLLRIYKILIQEFPEINLAITSDYRLWGTGGPGNEQFRVKWMHVPSVEFFGALPRQQLILEQLKSQITLYPSNYDELFCIAIAESQYAGSYPITSNSGSLPTTNMGTVLELDANDPRNDRIFADTVLELLTSNHDMLARKQLQVHLKAKERFSQEKILQEWDEKVFNG
jgi:glycosyltransferase involved in cell wall biosynthesis